MSKRKLFTGAALLLLLSLAATGIALLLSAPPKPEKSWRMTDGSTVRYLTTTYGTNHVLNYGHRLIDKLYPYLPAAVRSNFNFQVTRVSTPYPGTLVMWFEATGMTNNPNVSISGLSLPPGLSPQSQAQLLAQIQSPARNFYVSIVDESGVESSPVIASRRLGVTNGFGIYSALVRMYPRRSKMLNVKIYESSDARRVLAQFQIRNPEPQSPPNWSPEPLPLSRKTNELEVTLLSLEDGKPPSSSPYASSIPDRPSVRATFDIKVNGRLTTDWSIVRAVLRNAAGESNQTYFPSPANIGRNSATLTLYYPMWSEEPAWKLEVEVARIAGFGPEETWTSFVTEIPPAGQTVILNGPGSLLGREINTNSFATLQVRLPPASFPAEAVSTYPSLSFSFQMPDGLWLTLIRMKDDRGRVTPINSGSLSTTAPRGSSPPSRRRTFSSGNLAGAKSLEITVGASPVVTFEFTVKAPNKPPAAPAPKHQSQGR